MNFNNVLNLEHFKNEELVNLMRKILPNLSENNPNYPRGAEHRKHWEMAMTVRALEKFGAIHKDAEILSVGAGQEATLYFLTNYVKRVFAIDLYAGSGAWSKEAPKNMLVNPGFNLPPEIKWNPQRLIVQHMDGRTLYYPDNSFDGVFSNSSIEHFGGLEDVALSAKEIGRVLKPGGILSLSTEYRIKGPMFRPNKIGFPGVIIFDREMIQRYIIEPSTLYPVDDIDYSVSKETISSAYPLKEAVNPLTARIPSVALLNRGFTFTSISLTLMKK